MTSELAIIKKDTAFQKLTIYDLNQFGYELTGRQIPLGSKPNKFAIMEVKNDDNMATVGFCYLFSIADQSGVILSHNFDYCVRHPDILFRK